MTRLMYALLGISGAGFWLALLVETGFDAVSVCIGLLAALFITGRA